MGYVYEKTGKLLGDFIGVFLEYDSKYILSIWREYVCVCTRLNVRFSLKRCKKVIVSRGRAVKVKFRYEKLPIFCFICGRIGYMDKFCPKILDLKDESEDLPKEWSVDLQVDMQKVVGSGDMRWLHDGNGGKMAVVAEGKGDDAVVKEKTLTSIDVDKETPMEGMIPMHLK